MINVDSTSPQHYRLAAYFLVFILYLYILVRRNPKDRVLLFEAFGVSVFLIALILYSLFQLPDWLMFAAGFTAVSFGVLALYFALVNWARRRVRSHKAK